MNIKKITFLFLLLFIFQINLATPTHAEPLEVSIPIIVPLTGSMAEQGQWIKEGAELAQKEINKTNQIKINLLLEDSQIDPKIALSVYRELKSRTTFPVFLSVGSGIAMALAPLANRDQIIQMGVATSVSEYSSPHDYNFRNYPSAKQEAEYLAKVIKDRLEPKSIALIKQNNDYGLSIAARLKELLQGTKHEIIIEETILPGSSDFRSQLLKIKQLKPELVFFAVYSNEGAQLLKQMKQLGMKSVLLASAAMLGNIAFFQQSAGGAEGLLISMPSLFDRINPSPMTQKLIQDYQETYSKQISPGCFLVASAYDAIKILVAGMVKCHSSSSTCLKDYLETVRNYPGAGGSISFDENGDIESEFFLTKVGAKDFSYSIIK